MGQLLILFGVLCIGIGIWVYGSEKQNKIFSKYPIVVRDVREYNRFCGKLLIVFGIVAELTMLAMVFTRGIVSLVFVVILLAEAIVATRIYVKNEKKFRIK